MFEQSLEGILACLLALLAVQVRQISAADASCSYSQDIELGVNYYIYNAAYPNNNAGPIDCQWIIRSSDNIILNCSTHFEAPEVCVLNRITLQSNTGTDTYCSSGEFLKEFREEVTVGFVLAHYGNGRFLCSMKASKEISEGCVCGRKNPSRIVGGKETGVNEYPMMAGIVDFIKREIDCGGTIIAQRYVITAASCVMDQGLGNIGVVVGEHDFTAGSETNATSVYIIQNIIIHPMYDSSSGANNIAIVQTNQIEYNFAVGPACLPFRHQRDSYGGDLVSALGWGAEKFGGTGSTTLQQVDLNVITNERCSQLDPNVTITSDTLCTFTPGKDACQMDTGGPLLWEDPTTHNLVLAGIINKPACAADNPSLHVRVGSYVDWILNATAGTEYCMVE